MSLFAPDFIIKRGGGSAEKSKDRESNKNESGKDKEKKRRQTEEEVVKRKKPNTEAPPSSSAGNSGSKSYKFGSSAHPDLVFAYNNIYKPNGLYLSANPSKEVESEEYAAYNFSLNGHPLKFRSAKITPTKNGAFVTLWKRASKDSPIAPFDLKDSVEGFIVSVRENTRFGQFVFPKSVLAEWGIVSKGGRGGKRAMRVYPPWVKAESRQAENTQGWQIKYFLNLADKEKVDLAKARRLLSFVSGIVKK